MSRSIIRRVNSFLKLCFPLLLAGMLIVVVSPVTWAIDSPPVTETSPSGSDDPDSNLVQYARKHIIEREYQASRNGHGLQAPNRVHNLRTYFNEFGIRIEDRTAADNPILLGLSLSRMGREGAMFPVGQGEVSSTGHRVEITRQGVTEWYENTAAGLEQGFTLESRPPGTGRLVLEQRIGHAEGVLSGDQVRFRSREGRQLACSALVVVDAEGQVIDSYFELADELLRIVVEDGSARYPITIDPLITGTADTMFEADQENASLGDRVAGAGDVNGDGFADVLVGAKWYDAGEYREGAAFLFLGGPGGIADGAPASADAQIESNQASAYMGASMDCAGDVNGDGYDDIIIGAEGYMDYEGLALLFLGGPSGIAGGGPADADARFEPNQGTAVLGSDVAGAGDVDGDGYSDIIIGSMRYDAGQTDEGAAFIFLGSATGMPDGHPGNAAARLESDQADARFGENVASAGDVNGDGYDDVIISALFWAGGQPNEGAAFIFHGSAAGISSGDPGDADGRIEANQVEAQLGRGLDGAGDVNGDGYSDVIVGAFNYSAGENKEGAAFVFHGSASGITATGPASADAQIESNQEFTYLGNDVAGVGDLNGDGYADIVVAAWGYDGSLDNQGAALVFLGGPSGIDDGTLDTADMLIEGDQEGAVLGCSVAGAGDINGDGYDDLIIGAAGYDNGHSNEGAAFIYHGGAFHTGIATWSTGGIYGDPADGHLGWSVAGAGDVNGDGYADVIIGAPEYDGGETNEGAAYIYHGTPWGISYSVASLLEADQGSALFGCSVAGAGDVNGDGYADVIVGSCDYDMGEADEGAAFVFHGSPTGVADGSPATAAAQLEADQADSNFGISVAGTGDVNGDGYADILVGADSYDWSSGFDGAAFVFHGSASGIASGNPVTAATRLESNQSAAQFGFSTAGAGDINGDGFADVIVGAPYYDSPHTDGGAAFIFHGSDSGIADGNPGNAATRLDTFANNNRFGCSVAGAGDVNGDGFADVIVGAYMFFAGGTEGGAAFIYHGSATGIADGDQFTAQTRLSTSEDYAHMGYSVAGAGDVNGDGYADVIVAAPLLFHWLLWEDGMPCIFLGGPDGIPDGTPHTASALLYGTQAVAGAGDVNGDGFADVIVGEHDWASYDRGRALLFNGNGNRQGREAKALQFRGDGSGTPVQPWGLSGTTDSFEVQLSASHPEGSGLVKAEIEYCPLGTLFGEPGCGHVVSADWTPVGPPDTTVSLVESITGLSPDTLYRWRARVLFARASADQPGITGPPNPSHGPWRRVSAQTVEGDIRTAAVEWEPTLSAELQCVPSSGTLPFISWMTLTLTNQYEGQTRRFAGHIDVTLAGGQYYSNWRVGYLNVAPGESIVTEWDQHMPTYGTIVGGNLFAVYMEDVTPAPYNQPPYPPAGDTDTVSCIITGLAP